MAIEMALQAKKGHVYAVERKSAAIDLLHQNKDRFSVDNLTVISGSAPDVCSDLPPPSHAFIGGSSGNMRDILEQLLAKNPSVRIVATSISLETIAELTSCVKAFSFSDVEVVLLHVARAKKTGEYHLMTGQNPILSVRCRVSRKERRMAKNIMIMNDVECREKPLTQGYVVFLQDGYRVAPFKSQNMGCNCLSNIRRRNGASAISRLPPDFRCPDESTY